MSPTRVISYYSLRWVSTWRLGCTLGSALVWAWVVLRVFKLYADVGVVASFTVSERETEPLAPTVKTAHGRIRLTNAYSYSTKVVGFGGRRSLITEGRYVSFFFFLLLSDLPSVQFFVFSPRFLLAVLFHQNAFRAYSATRVAHLRKNRYHKGMTSI
ncbi:hypothetical protein E1B28_008065 [Marasmius oreades]|uniref:Uncharacterized protein n=1 Tax=Marasmius oreades TaxID=181124 RepID=A0A9P7S2Y8_9AGAR|nr:uncharacterized protein E1B28_008065 [Marasmius oreades]KAG7094469.1 hypothetical protein E1B28_008065 [Marasmius oreades]